MILRDLLRRIERASAIAPIEPRPEFPAEDEPAAIYLAIALQTKVGILTAPESVLARLLELRWIRGVQLRTDRSHGIAWVDWGRGKRTGILTPQNIERFVAAALARQFNPQRG